MIGFIGLFGWVLVGLMVAALERSTRPDQYGDLGMVTVLSVAGAMAGAFLGQTFGWYVFGEPLGFIFSVAGAELLLLLARRPSARSPAEAAPSAPVAVPRPAPPATPNAGVGVRLVEAFAWGALCAMAVGVAGFVGHLVGGRVYPQRYEQIPSDFFFVPLGLLAGFLSAGTARLARPQWSVTAMFTVVVVAAAAYSGLMFEYARSRAVGASLTVTFDPNPATAVRCDPVACPQADPPLQWMVQGRVRVRETNGIGAIVDAISLVSYETPDGRRTVTKEQAVEMNEFAGPRVRLTGRDIVGGHYVKPDEPVSYPIRYSYRTRLGDSRRNVSVYVEFTDAAGRPSVAVAQWSVR